MARIVLLLLVLALCARAQAPSQEELARRAADVRNEARAYGAGAARRAEERRLVLSRLGVIEVVKLSEHGDPGRCMDAVFIGDGFAKDDQSGYNAVVDRMAKNFDTAPFGAYRTQVNLYRFNLVSKRSGIGEENAPPLGGHVKKFPGGKLLANDMERTVEIARTAVPEMDYVLCVLNTQGQFLGSANTGRIVRLSTAGAHQHSLVMHEFGHNFVGLVDEYVDGKQSGAGALPLRLKQSINAGLEKNVLLAKWHYWNIPGPVFLGVKRGKPFRPEENVRCYEGAATFADGAYRAEDNCHMQRGRGKAYCRVCTEASEVGLYRFFAPIERVEPHDARVVAGAARNLVFSVWPVATPDSVRCAWYLDGKRLNPRQAKALRPRGFSYRLPASAFGEGTHYVSVRVDVDSPRVRMDGGRLSAWFSWSVEAAPDAALWTGPDKLSFEAGGPIEVTAAAGWKARNLPAAWQPGAYRIDFENGAATHAVEVTVRSKEKRGNRPPVFLFLPPQEGVEGDELSFRALAYDADGERLAWSASGLPAGARLDPDTGRFVWKPGFTQRGRYDIDMRVTDGQKVVKATAALTVRGAALFRGILRTEPSEFGGATDWMLVALHHPLGSARLDAARRLTDAPSVVRFSESLRLLRDSSPDIRALALENLGGMEHIDMFLDVLARRAWQLVDLDDAREKVASLAKAALDRAERPQKKELQALLKDLALIDAYNKDRRARPAPPPVTDKKYR